MSTAKPGFLDGVRVLDFTRVISGPYATMMLADMGADVVKVEEPTHGDEMRNIRFEGRAPHHHDYFNTNNRSKRSIALNLKSPEHVRIAQQLAEKADVVVENFAPGVAERLDIGWRTLHKRNPTLVYCSISGFGQSGPYRSRPALDPIIQALCGVMSVTGCDDGPPLQVGAPLADAIAGMFAAFCIVCAWTDVQRSQAGRYIDISMLDAMIAALGPRMGEALQAGLNPARHGNSNPMRVPTNVYLTSDHRHLMVAVMNDGHWHRLCDALGQGEWAQRAEFRTMTDRKQRRRELDLLVAAEIAKRPAADWQALFDRHRVPCGMVNSYLETIEDPQVRHRELIRTIDHPRSGPIRVVGTPWKISGHDPSMRPPPLLGEHTAEVLRDWLSLGQDQAQAIQRHSRARDDQ
ncbi:MAG: CoA transferase [Burkholderiales bacterium]|nr:CoA transferase [Burkholderiales bacterium]